MTRDRKLGDNTSVTSYISQCVCLSFSLNNKNTFDIKRTAKYLETPVEHVLGTFKH